jgi:hypothetical protein
MKIFFSSRLLVISGIFIGAVLFVFTAGATAETWLLELKSLAVSEPSSNIWNSSTLMEYLINTSSAQTFQAQVGAVGKNRVDLPGAAEQAAEFKKIVKKEPKYQSDYPFRGVAKLGSKRCAFALDAVPPEVKAEKAKAEDAKEKNKKAKTPKKIIGYNRLYLDSNGNGDLTDDKPIVAESTPEAESAEEAESKPEGEAATEKETPTMEGDTDAGILAFDPGVAFNFPKVEVVLDAEGKKTNFAFSLGGYLVENAEFKYASVSLKTSMYREGDITLDGKTLHILLLDSDGNGLFNDVASVKSKSAPAGDVEIEEGDMLLIDPPAAKPGQRRSWFQFCEEIEKCRRRISKVVDIDGRYYDLKISPTGDKITLAPTQLPLGSVTNPNDGYSAVIYSDLGFITINGNKDVPVAVPAGKWKLLSYKIDRTKLEEAEEKAKKPDAPKQSIFKALSNSLVSMSLRSGGLPRPQSTCVEAQAGSGYKAVEVRKGETVTMPFGPPYKPVVKAGSFNEEKKVAYLSLSLIGSAGEQCTDLEIKGNRPAKPEFTLTDSKGEEVLKGSFEYG